MNKPTEIIIHCSDSTWGNAKEIDRWHKNRGWKGIGYHYVICTDGTIEAGRNIREQGAHCLGHNTTSIGICLIGKNEFTKIQLKELKYFLVLLCNVYNIKKENIFGHYEFSSKTCPNFNVENFVKTINNDFFIKNIED